MDGCMQAANGPSPSEGTAACSLRPPRPTSTCFTRPLSAANNSSLKLLSLFLPGPDLIMVEDVVRTDVEGQQPPEPGRHGGVGHRMPHALPIKFQARFEEEGSPQRIEQQPVLFRQSDQIVIHAAQKSPVVLSAIGVQEATDIAAEKRRLLRQ